MSTKVGDLCASEVPKVPGIFWRTKMVQKFWHIHMGMLRYILIFHVVELFCRNKTENMHEVV